MSNVDQGLKDMVSVLQVHAEAVSAVSVNQELLLALKRIVRNISKDYTEEEFSLAEARTAIAHAEAL